MCIRGRFIVNRYDDRQYFIKCGHCDACMQEKADRHKRRINFESRVNNVLPVFCTLTYDNNHVPYLSHRELIDFVSNPYLNTLTLHRDSSKLGVERVLNVNDFMCSNRDKSLYLMNVAKMPYLREKVGDKYIFLRDKVGVLWLRDLQLFIKRLKINLVRNGYQGYFSYYYASEYGSRYCRPHFHLLFYIDPAFYSRFITIICKSWPHANLFEQQCFYERKPIEIAKNPARYVSSYLNCSSYVPQFLQFARPFHPFTRFSNGFGCNMQAFTLPQIVKKAQRGIITYITKRIVGGVSTVSEVKFPNYICNRYFPKFKGYRYLLSDEVIQFARRPSSVYFSHSLDNVLDSDDRDKLYHLLCSLQKKVINAGVSIDDWSLVYPVVNNLSSSFAIKSSYDFLDLPFEFERNCFEHFNNIKDFYHGEVSHGLLDSLPLQDNSVIDPNLFHRNLVDDSRKSVEFFNSVKHHKIKNYYYEESYF